jgi:cell fate (sporulation/competence/biofilm development) regulator YlbF (YheA/YmcA/DUF963 family)
MVPQKELQELANALKKTGEYENMMQNRRNVMNKYRQMMTGFEREHAQLYRQKLSEEEMISRLKALYAKYQDFLGKDDVLQFLEAARTYQKLVSECVAQLNRLLEADGPGRMF